MTVSVLSLKIISEAKAEKFLACFLRYRSSTRVFSDVKVLCVTSGVARNVNSN